MNRRVSFVLAASLLTGLLAGVSALPAQANQKPFDIHILPDNKRFVAAGEDGALALLTIPDLTVERRFSGEAAKLKSVAVSPDGKLLAAHYDKAKLWIFDVETGAAKFQIGGPDLKPGPMMFTPDGRLLVLSNSNVLTQFDAATGAQIGTPMRVWGGMAALSPDGKYLVGLGGNEEVHMYDIVANQRTSFISWRSAPGLEQFKSGWRAETVFLGFRADGRISLGLFFQRVAAAVGDTGSMQGRVVSFKLSTSLDKIRVESTPKLEVSIKPLVSLTSSRVYPDGRVLALASGSMRFLNVDAVDDKAAWETVDPGKTRMLDGGDVSADGVWVVACSKRSGEIEVWDTRTIEKRDKKMFGRTILSWNQPKLVKLAAMP